MMRQNFKIRLIPFTRIYCIKYGDNYEYVPLIKYINAELWKLKKPEVGTPGFFIYNFF